MRFCYVFYFLKINVLHQLWGFIVRHYLYFSVLKLHTLIMNFGILPMVQFLALKAIMHGSRETEKKENGWHPWPWDPLFLAKQTKKTQKEGRKLGKERNSLIHFLWLLLSIMAYGFGLRVNLMGLPNCKNAYILFIKEVIKNKFIN